MDPGEFAERLAGLRETRARLPELVRNRHAARRRRTVAGHSGRLLLVEVDGPARAVLAAGAEPAALADRGLLLRALAEALAVPGVDGVIATADIVDDLLLLEQLEDRLVLGALNPGGIVGSAFEAEDPYSAYDAATVAASHLDGGKVRLHLTLSDPATPVAIEAAAHAVSALAADGVLALVEPIWCQRGSAGTVVDRSPEALIRAVDVAAALGSRSPYTWLELPVSDDLDHVVAATTLPVLVRIDEAPAEPDEAERWQAALALQGVRGLILPAGRVVADPAVCEVAAGLVRAAADAGRRR